MTAETLAQLTVKYSYHDALYTSSTDVPSRVRSILEDERHACGLAIDTYPLHCFCRCCTSLSPDGSGMLISSSSQLPHEHPSPDIDLHWQLNCESHPQRSYMCWEREERRGEVSLIPVYTVPAGSGNNWKEMWRQVAAEIYAGHAVQNWSPSLARLLAQL